MVSHIGHTKQSQKLLEDPANLLKLYQEQFIQIRHIENADSFSLAFITVITLAIFFFMHHSIPVLEKHDIIGLGVILIFLLGGPGIYGTTRRMTYRMRHLAVVSRVSKIMGAVQTGVIPASFGTEVAGSLWDFGKRIILGYRGPVIVFYSVLMWGIVFSLYFELLGAQSLAWAVITGFLIVAFANASSMLASWATIKEETLALKQEMELGTSMTKSMAEQYCDLADSMMRLRPPRLNEALSYYEESLSLEPLNSRAQEGVNKLMSWKVKDYRYKSQ